MCTDKLYIGTVRTVCRYKLHCGSVYTGKPNSATGFTLISCMKVKCTQYKLYNCVICKGNLYCGIMYTSNLNIGKVYTLVDCKW